MAPQITISPHLQGFGGADWSIVLYVPDSKVREMSRGSGSSLALWREPMDELMPGWWESAHTARLGEVRIAVGTARAR